MKKILERILEDLISFKDVISSSNPSAREEAMYNLGVIVTKLRLTIHEVELEEDKSDK